MIELLKLILLGIIQGISEFLPISSSGHLIFFERLINFKEPGLFIAQMLHFGTFLSVFILFFKDIKLMIIEFIKLISSLIKREKIKLNYHQKMAVLIIVGSIPTALIAILFEDTFKVLYENRIFLSMMFLITAIILYMLDLFTNRNKTIDKMTYLGSVAVGAVQGLAILPGISRSGSTIFASTFIGHSREEAARFSFLLSLPATFGAFLFGMKDVVKAQEQVSFNFPIIVGMIVSMVVGIISLKFLIKILSQRKMKYFSYYLIAISLLNLLLR